MRLTEFERTMPLDSDVVNKTKQFYQSNPNTRDPYDSSENDTAQDFKLDEYLAELGWDNIGNGAFSSIFENPAKPYVMKINPAYDRGFARFALFTRQNPNEHFPKIGNAKMMVIGGKKYAIYLMEKLNRLSSTEAIDLVGFCIAACKGEYEEMSKSTMEKFQWQMDSLFDACMELKQNSDKVVIDFHQGNLMVRDDGTVVIVDPFAPVRQ